MCVSSNVRGVPNETIGPSVSRRQSCRVSSQDRTTAGASARAGLPLAVNKQRQIRARCHMFALHGFALFTNAASLGKRPIFVRENHAALAHRYCSDLWPGNGTESLHPRLPMTSIDGGGVRYGG